MQPRRHRIIKTANGVTRRVNTGRNRASLLAAGVVFACSAAMGQQARFIPLNNADGAPGCNDNGCYLSDEPRISRDGATVFGKSYVAGNHSGRVPWVPFRWTESEGIEAIGPDPSGARGVVGVDTFGESIVGDRWFWTADGGYDVAELDELSILYRVRGATPDLGLASGITSSTQARGHFVWNYAEGKEPQILIEPSIEYGWLGYDPTISQNGRFVGSTVWFENYDSQAAIWDLEANTVELISERFDNGDGGVVDFSSDGSVAVGFASIESVGFGVAGFRWTRDEGLMFIAETSDEKSFSPVRACSADASVLVGQTRRFGANDGIAYLWTESRGISDIERVLIDEYGLGNELSGWSLEDAHDVSADGRSIVVTGLNPAGELEAALVVIPDLTPPQLIFESIGNSFRPGEAAELVTFGGESDQQVGLVLTAIDGVPQRRLLSQGRFDGSGTWRALVEIPSSLSAESVSLVTVGTAQGGGLQVSNDVTIAIN